MRIHRHAIVLTPPLNRQVGIDFAPICIEYHVQLIVAVPGYQSPSLTPAQTSLLMRSVSSICSI